MTKVLCIFAVACLLAGCAGLKTDRDVARERTQIYLAAHPNLAPNVAEAIKAYVLLEGMTMEQVIGAWGRPAVVQKFRDGAVQYWFFGCDWPHFCDVPERRFPEPDEIFQSRALFENGVVVEWQS